MLKWKQVQLELRWQIIKVALNRLSGGSTNLWALCSRSASGTRSSGSGLGWNARPPPCWCHPGSRWTGRSGSSGTRRLAAAPCPPLWWPAAQRGRVGCWAAGGFPFWNRKPASGIKKTNIHRVFLFVLMQLTACYYYQPKKNLDLWPANLLEVYFRIRWHGGCLVWISHLIQTRKLWNDLFPDVFNVHVDEISFAASIFWLKAQMFAGFLNMHVGIFCEIKKSAVKLLIMTAGV